MTPPIKILVLPGFMCDERLFVAQHNYFSEISDTGGGNGGDSSVSPVEIYFASLSLNRRNSLEELAKDVINLSRSLEEANSSPIILCGFSMGGIVAMEVLRQAGDRFGGLILMSTHARVPSEAQNIERKLERHLLKEIGLRRLIAENFLPTYFPPGHESPALAALLMNMATTLGETVCTDQLTALIRRNGFQSTLKAWTRATLIIAGKEDLRCPPELQKELSALMPHSTLEILPEVGHFPTLEAPNKVNAILSQWIHQHFNNTINESLKT